MVTPFRLTFALFSGSSVVNQLFSVIISPGQSLRLAKSTLNYRVWNNCVASKAEGNWFMCLKQKGIELFSNQWKSMQAIPSYKTKCCFYTGPMVMQGFFRDHYRHWCHKSNSLCIAQLIWQSGVSSMCHIYRWNVYVNEMSVHVSNQ